MLTAPEPCPDAVLDAAARLAAAVLGENEPELASRPVPVHRMQRTGDGSGRWDPVLPRIGWAVPVFSGGEAIALCEMVAEGEGRLRDARPGTPLGAALDRAAFLAEGLPTAATLRLVEVPGGADAFWIEWAHDTFVVVDTGAVVSGPEFASIVSAD